jgi:hypothetical protein
MCKHLAYLGNQANSITILDLLSQLISTSGADPTKIMGLYERVRLAKHLTTAVLYYHATPWLKKSWRSDDVYFFRAQDSSLQEPEYHLPYMATIIRASNPSRGRLPALFSQQRRPDYPRYRR